MSISECETLTADPIHFHESLEKLTDVIVHDIFSPPVASRIYTYPCIAAYEVIQQTDPNFKSFSSQLNGLTDLPLPKDTANLSYNIAAISAFLQTGKIMIFSEAKMQEQIDLYKSKLDSIGIPKIIIEASFEYGSQVSNHILQWAGKDNYNETRSAPKYTITQNPKEWKPTPPAYMDGIEPHWREIRTMVLKNADQFKPAAPPAFELKKGSDFYNKTLEVYDAVKNATPEQTAIASFWDCNPYVMNQKGHMMFATKKITPGGHWMGIAGIASKEANHNLLKATETASMVSIALFDGFISCWDEKYRSNLIRPESVINEHIDEKWVPLLQTPPFPEHPSGHSVISTAAARILTQLLGDNFSYTDDVEVKYGLPKRKYNSFNEASAEAAISRLYGGIHYMPAITDGVKQGEQVAAFINQQISTRY